jgi:hypothetical protein
MTGFSEDMARLSWTVAHLGETRFVVSTGLPMAKLVGVSQT